MNNIKINIAYDNLFIYDEIDKTFLYEPNDIKVEGNTGYSHSIIEKMEKKLNIKFPYSLKRDDNIIRQGISEIYFFMFPFYKAYNIFNEGLLNDFINKKKKFIYPIILVDNFIFSQPVEFLNLSEDLVKAIKDGYGKLVFSYIYEGHFGTNLYYGNYFTDFGLNYTDYKWLSSLSTKYGFKKDDVILITGNLMSNEIKNDLIQLNYIEDNYTIHPFSWFSYELFFHKNSGKKLLLDVKKSFYNHFFSCIENNRINKKQKHFLSFNRLSKTHRLCIFGELMTNINFKNKFIVSLGNINTVNPNGSFLKMIDSAVSSNYKHNKQRLVDFFTTYDQTKHYTYDCSDFENNKADTFNYNAHSNTFVNIVNESLINNHSIFFSEKIFKPIYSCQPFILFGNPFSLRKLKEMGYKTFDKWWDESYDEEVNFTKRLEKIIDVMIQISSWSLDDCYRITNEMESVLVHNFNNMMNDGDTFELFNFLNTNTNTIQLSNIKNNKII